MDNLDTKLRENDFSSNQTAFLSQKDHMKAHNVMKVDDFPSEFQNPSKPTSFLQDFHYLDQFHVNGLSSNPVFSIQASSYDPLDPYAYENDMDYCKAKPSVGSMNGGHGHVMDNFQSADDHDHTFFNIHPQGNVFDHNVTGSDQNQMIPFDCPELIKPVNFVMPDEVSCVSAENDCYKRIGLNKNKVLLARKTWRGRKRSSVVKGQWTIEEDRILIQLVEQYGVRKWSHIAQMLPGRVGKQCRERWHNHLRPDIKKDTWTEDEDKVLIEAHTEIGNKWAEIAKRLPGRTENSIKNHWNATKRRQFSKRKCRSKHPRCSLLQDYIKSLNLDSSATNTRRRRRDKVNNNNGDVNNDNRNDGGVGWVQQEPFDFYGADDDDRSVPESMVNGDLKFNEKLFGDNCCSIESLLEEMGNGSEDCAKFGGDMGGLMDFEVKKEMDLVEMISQGNV